MKKVDMFYQELAEPVRHFKEKEKERIDNSFEHIKNLMEAMKMTAEQARAVLKITDADRAILAKRF